MIHTKENYLNKEILQEIQALNLNKTITQQLKIMEVNIPKKYSHHLLMINFLFQIKDKVQVTFNLCNNLMRQRQKVQNEYIYINF